MRTIRSSADEENVGGFEAIKTPSTRNISGACLRTISPRAIRWVPQRKAEVLTAVRRGEISLSQACALYEISVEEFLSWQRKDALYGLVGLRATVALPKRSVAENTRPMAETPHSILHPSPAE
jgi:hypothetical protein